jgi:hypothetical protein
VIFDLHVHPLPGEVGQLKASELLPQNVGVV